MIVRINQFYIDLYNYYEFFEKIIAKVCIVFIKQNVFALELRHIFGMVIDDEGKQIPLEEEIEIFHRVFKKIKQDYPLFNCKLIVCGLKIVGKDHIEKMIQGITDGIKITKIIAGFDMVNEEDFCAPIKDFLKEIIEAEHAAEGKFPVVLHAGESCESRNENLYDAILLGTKRIGHGFALA